MADLARPTLITPDSAGTLGLSGVMVAVTAIASNFSDAQLVYQATGESDKTDEITLWASNVDAAATWVLAVGFGGKTADCFSYTTIAPIIGPVKCIPTWRLRGGPIYVICLTTALANGTASKLNVHFDRTRYTESG